jgi:hypothetical protein
MAAFTALTAFIPFVRSLLPRRVGSALPTMHSLRGMRGQRSCPPCGSFRKVRVVSGSGRLVISGRMADVCAELERLAALESACNQAFAPAK